MPMTVIPVTIPSARSIVDALATLKRDLLAAKQAQSQVEVELAGRKVEVVSFLLASNGDAGLGKTDADKVRKVDEALSNDQQYQSILKDSRLAKSETERLTVEVDVFSDYFALARLEARVGLAESLRGTGTALSDL